MDFIAAPPLRHLGPSRQAVNINTCPDGIPTRGTLNMPRKIPRKGVKKPSAAYITAVLPRHVKAPFFH